MPEAQTLLIVSEGTSFGMPALIWAWREGIWPWPACRTWPKTTCSTCSGATPERSSAASITVPPRSVASSEERAPPILPKGVRAVPRITELGIYCLSFPSLPGLGSTGRQVQRVTIPTACASRIDSRPMKVEVEAESSCAEAGADLLAVGALRGRGAARGARRRAPARRDAKGGFKKLLLLHPERLRAGAGGRPRQARGARRRAAARRRRARRQGGRAAGGALARLGAARGRRRRRGRRGARHRARSSPPTASTASSPATDDEDPPRLESLTLLGPARARRRGRGRPRRRRGPEPGPRPAEPARQRRHPHLPRRARRGDRRRLTTRSPSRSSAASRDRAPRAWAACSPSARAAPRSRS